MKVEGLGTAPKPKEWAWSYSKLKNYKVCPKKHYEVDLAKNYGETQDNDPDSALNWGNRVHAALATALKGIAPLPDEMKMFQQWVDRILAGPGQLHVEQKYAITRDFQKTGYFANNVWLRVIGDVVRIDGPVALVIDWKTGKVLEDHIQLMLMAQALFSHFPQLKRVRAEFVWLKDDCTTPEVFDRQEVANEWIALMPEVAQLENASKTLTYPPKPGGLCKSYCPVQSCAFYKKGSR